MSVKFTDNSKQVKSEMNSRIVQALELIGLIWLQNVDPFVPVDTSNLLKSMTYKVDSHNKTVIVGTPVDYGGFVELGTRNMKAQPYLRPSILDYRADYENAVRSVLGSGWSISWKQGDINNE